MRLVAAGLLAALLVACGSAPKRPLVIANKSESGTSVKSSAQLPKANSGRGAYYKDDGPGDNPPEGLEFTVDPIPVVEDFSRSGNKPYVVFGKTYTPIADNTTPFVQRGIGSWYGKKFHGQKTSSGELYDMYKITAAHPTLPIPSYARVTNLENGKQIIVRINDRGPFHSSRIIDLSYTAALKLGLLGRGSSQLEVERLLPADIERMAENRKNQVASPVAAVAVNAPANPASNKQGVDVKENAPDQMTIEDLLASQENKSVEKLEARTESASGYYLQFGAYAIRANAESIMTHLKNRAESLLPGFDIVQQGNLYRLISGPFSSRSEALSALNQAANLGVGRPLVVQR
ncbi:MAG: septal ring lytic transglycosylase RlpA family protein [Burkholderiales bacterium]|nr:septal ring lytic transglycosylase RlpA family protein [Burkholderiales bacterium]